MSDAHWKLKSGSTTFWNAGSQDILTPIIVPHPPMLTELEGAIITPREMEAKIDGRRQSRLRHATGGVYDHLNCLLPIFQEREAYEASVNTRNRLVNDAILSEQNYKDAQRLSGAYVYLGILRGHFGHFLLESLGRIWYFLKYNSGSKIIMHMEGNIGKLRPFMNYIFDLLDIDLDTIFIVKRPVVVEKLIIPESEFEIRWKAHSSYADTFRELFERSSRRAPKFFTPKRVYLTRRQLEIKTQSDQRKVVCNEMEIEQLFAQRGFEIIAPEKLPLHQQIAIVSRASQIAGMKGSALHLSLFSQRPRARLIQIGRIQSMNQSLIDGLKNMEGHQILCESAPTKSGSMVDLEILSAALREM